MSWRRRNYSASNFRPLSNRRFVFVRHTRARAFEHARETLEATCLAASKARAVILIQQSRKKDLRKVERVVLNALVIYATSPPLIVGIVFGEADPPLVGSLQSRITRESGVKRTRSRQSQFVRPRLRKDTRHFELDLKGWGLNYVGDSILG